MAEPPTYPPDADICRLLAEGPLPTAAIADRLAIPDRTARHRLRRLREAGVVVTGPEGLHRLAAPDVPDLAASAGGLATAAVRGVRPASDMPSTEDGGHGGVMAVLVLVGIGLAAAVVARRSPPHPPSAPRSPDGYGDG